MVYYFFYSPSLFTLIHLWIQLSSCRLFKAVKIINAIELLKRWEAVYNLGCMASLACMACMACKFLIEINEMKNQLHSFLLLCYSHSWLYQIHIRPFNCSCGYSYLGFLDALFYSEDVFDMDNCIYMHILYMVKCASIGLISPKKSVLWLFEFAIHLVQNSLIQ